LQKRYKKEIKILANPGLAFNWYLNKPALMGSSMSVKAHQEAKVAIKIISVINSTLWQRVDN